MNEYEMYLEICGLILSYNISENEQQRKQLFEEIKASFPQNDVNYRSDIAGYLAFACRRGETKLVRLFIELGATFYNNGPSPLHQAIRNNNFRCANILLNAGFDINYTFDTNHRPSKNVLTFVIWQVCTFTQVPLNQQREKQIMFLLDRGATIDKTMIKDNTCKEWYWIEKFISARLQCRQSAISILALSRNHCLLYGNGRDVVGLIARHVWSTRLQEEWKYARPSFRRTNKKQKY